MRRVAVAVAVAALALALADAGRAQTVVAAWQDSEYARGTITAGVLGEPTKITCQVGGLLGGATFFWDQPTGDVAPAGYRVTISRNGLPQNTLVLPSDARSVSSGSLLSSILGGSTYTVSVVAYLGSWTAAPIEGSFRTGLLGSVSSCTW